MFENQTLNKNRVLPSAMILDRLSIECIAKAATKEKIIESCCISSTNLVKQLVKSEPQYSKIVEKMADVYISLSQLLIALPIRDDDLNAAIKRKITRKLKHNPTLISGGVTHYAKFPNELAERCILCGTAEGDVVLDSFVGSGTSCRVANRYGRQYIGD